MKYPFTKFALYLYAALLTGIISGISGCSLEKKSAVNRGLQNLTAHYNILFNARETLRQKQEAYATGFIDDYSELLSVYQDTSAAPPGEDKDLIATKQRANNIISLKEQSHYIPDAYLVLGKANYLEANFFNAVEYFNYALLIATPKQEDLKQEARVWKARSLLYLNNTAEAKLVIDTAIQNVDTKRGITADVYATKLQFDINTGNYTEGEEMAKLAVEKAGNNLQSMRWTYILGQLQELNHKSGDAIISYSRVAHSNVSFDMAFNATLNRIRIEDSENGVKTSRIARLRSLLRNPNNNEFIDQIYYQIGQLQYVGNDVDGAIKSYKQSTNASQKNQNQKGLSYLRLADIYFKNKADYVSSKNYYDSSLINLSPNYPGYLTIKRKADNLQYLADKLDIISREDTAQMLAALNEPSRVKRIDEMVARHVLQQQTTTNPVSGGNSGFSAVDDFGNSVSPRASVPNGTSFYFYNPNAVSQGYTDFKRVWGSRKLEDNWRRSNRSSSDITINNTNTARNIDPDAVAVNIQKSPGQVDASSYRQDILQNLPLTPELLAKSNQRRYDAYLDIANFYRDVLDDKIEAALAYENILRLFPGTDNKAAIYYNLYRLYNDGNAPLSDKYRSLVLKEYPESPFAKTILDPDYGKRLNDEDTGFSILYNQVYDLYATRKYAQVITTTDGLLQQYPNNRYAAQLAYLKAFAAGHQEKLESFKADLQQIVAKYPADKLITPLVNQHLEYINLNHEELAARAVVITDREAKDLQFTIPIVYQQQTEYRKASTGGQTIAAPDVRKPEKKQDPATAITKVTPAVIKRDSTVNTTTIKELVKQPEISLEAPDEKPANIKTNSLAKPPSIFSDKDSTNYFFVVNVNSGTTNLSSSRFGIGQFNRVQYQGSPISHQLKNAGPDNQLIYVGRFYSLNDVKKYARQIVPLLPDIMKVPKGKYSFFIVTKKNLDKLADAKILESYVDFYQQTY
ncbi:hypothetical protein DYU05_17260 [Mucilaginibacter terrenus]|uniref:Tetratricopeptide repeat protein n=1 Tax=Mucilaginibacter terrenus TaxID=2482727 RepID=A0A3E2NMY0_9SPHI|nr:hypothetical protein [Mucilaginibacter terrenus]RFZ82355.1 hypothetical protein DYU05_17260 [Mucilaginibacter terrenus]